MNATNTNDCNVDVHHRNIAAALMIAFALLIFFPIGILGNALEWPANLDEDADHNLPLLLQERTSTFWGYFIYLIYSVLFFPMAHMMSTIVTEGIPSEATSKSCSALLSIGSGFAALSTVCRSIGLCRWLFAMPTLARIYIDPKSTDTTKEAIAAIYEMLNDWGGGIGEILGVSAFAALWIGCTSALFVKSSVWPSWMGWAGFLVAIDLALNMLEMSILDYDMGLNLTLSVVLLHLWILLAALLFLRAPACIKFCAQQMEEADNGAIDAEDNNEG